MTKKIFKIFVLDWILPIVLAVGIAFLINNFLLFFSEVTSGSMIPTLNINDRVIVTKVYDYKNLKRGDIVVFHSDELDETLIKRLIGLPGDHIEINDGDVSINGKIIEENYVKNNEVTDRELVYDVPKDKYFFLGDNRVNSYDSRKWKNPFIDKKDIEGKAKLKIYPFKDFGSIK